MTDRRSLAAIALTSLSACILAACVAKAIGQAEGHDAAAAEIALVDAGPAVAHPPLSPAPSPAPAAVAPPGAAASPPAAGAAPVLAAGDGAMLAAPRKNGALWLALLGAIVLLAREYRARAMPKPGEPEPDPRSWRARSIAIAGALVTVSASATDAIVGAGSWWAVLITAVGVLLLMWPSLDPRKGSKLVKAAPSPVTGAIISLVIVGALTGCRPATTEHPHPTRDVLRELAVELLGAGVEVACDPAIAEEMRPDESRPVARAVFDAARKRLCPVVP